MDDELRKQWSGLIQPHFPNQAVFVPRTYGDDYSAEVSWELGNDPERPSKKSKTIVIIVSRETIDDYLTKSQARQNIDKKKLAAFIATHLHEFDPDHDNPVGVLSPEVEWIINSDVLNG